MVNVLIADDNLAVRNLLRAAFDARNDLAVAGEARDGEEAIRLERELNPDVVVLDLNMPKLDGRDVVAAIRKRGANARIVVFSMHTPEDFIIDRKTIDDYVGKTDGLDKLLIAVSDARKAGAASVG
jgi:DNA-binding NarL/FixJ family response regulator